VRSWIVIPGARRGGRSRRYFELTERGVLKSEATTAGVAALLGLHGGRADTTAEIAVRRRRIELGAELSETALILRLHATKAGGAA
jgi:hypothetical protein